MALLSDSHMSGAFGTYDIRSAGICDELSHTIPYLDNIKKKWGKTNIDKHQNCLQKQ